MEIIVELQKNEGGVTDFSLHQQGMLRYKGRLEISKSSTMLPTILHTDHDSIFGGHSGYLQTYKRLMGELYWEGMKQDVKMYCEECIVFQHNKSLVFNLAGLLLPLEVSDSIWSDISWISLMDYLRLLGLM